MDIYTLVLGCCATNTYVLVENGRAVVVDPADEAERICSFVARKQAIVEQVLITHGHFDHIKAARELQKCGAEIYMSGTDYGLVDFGNVNSVFGAPSDRFVLDVEVRDGHEFEISGHIFKVLETPGHTVGSVCYIMDDGIIFSGDTLFKLGVGRTDFPHGNFSELNSSLKKLFSLTHDYRVLPGHGSETSLYFEKQNNPYANY